MCNNIISKINLDKKDTHSQNEVQKKKKKNKDPVKAIKYS
jgi:hypothetical protein